MYVDKMDVNAAAFVKVFRTLLPAQTLNPFHPVAYSAVNTIIFRLVLLFCPLSSVRAVGDLFQMWNLLLTALFSISASSQSLFDSFDMSINPSVMSCPVLPVITSTLASFSRSLSRRTIAFDRISSRIFLPAPLLCRVLGKHQASGQRFCPSPAGRL